MLGANREKKNLAAVLAGLKRVHERGKVRLHLVVSGAPDTPQLRRDLGLVIAPRLVALGLDAR